MAPGKRFDRPKAQKGILSNLLKGGASRVGGGVVWDPPASGAELLTGALGYSTTTPPKVGPESQYVPNTSATGAHPWASAFGFR